MTYNAAPLDALLNEERATYLDVLSTSASHAYTTVQRALIEELLSIKGRQDLSALLAAEQAIVQNELVHNCNSTAMRKSFSEALDELSVMQKLAIKARHCETYAGINEAYQLPHNRRGDLPYDEARQSFVTHSARLRDLLTARLSHTQKKLIQCRLKNLRMAWQLYIGLQRKALKPCAVIKLVQP